jgi:hypothetical protein
MAVISYYFGRIGAFVALHIAALLLFTYVIWLPRDGVNGWTGEPREKYYALRGWLSPDR